MRSIDDFLAMSGDDFAARHAPSVARERAREAAARAKAQTAYRRTVLDRVSPGIASRIAAPDNPYPNPTQKEQEVTSEKAILVRTLMTADPNVRIMGRLPSEILQEMMKGDTAVLHREQPNTPGRGRIEPSQAAIDAMSPAQYDEFTRTGTIEGLLSERKTRSDHGSESYNFTYRRQDDAPSNPYADGEKATTRTVRTIINGNG